MTKKQLKFMKDFVTKVDKGGDLMTIGKLSNNARDFFVSLLKKYEK